MIFNFVFSATFPETWSVSRFFTIFKKGSRLDPSNYRDFSTLNACAKVYDGVLNNRFIQWYQPSPEQAGRQKGRSCEEQIMTICLLIDVARKTKKKLYITFIDYQKAYDMVDCQKLLNKLKDKGCGSRFLNALGESLQIF
jgi:hypothetical protein